MRMLFLDVETAAHTVNSWGLFDQNIGLNQVIETSYMLCFAAQWYGSPKIRFEAVWKDKDAMLAAIHALLDEADVVLGWNSKRFDVPTINKELILAGYPPPSPFKQIDLLVTARRQFKFASNKLQFVAKALGVGEKVKHPGFDLWTGVIAGDEKCQKLMEKYNKQDVALLVPLYEILRPWIKSSGVNVGLYEGLEHACPSCGSQNLQSRGLQLTTTYRYKRYQCQDCGSWSRSAMTERPTNRAKVVPA